MFVLSCVVGTVVVIVYLAVWLFYDWIGDEEQY